MKKLSILTAIAVIACFNFAVAQSSSETLFWKMVQERFSSTSPNGSGPMKSDCYKWLCENAKKSYNNDVSLTVSKLKQITNEKVAQGAILESVYNQNKNDWNTAMVLFYDMCGNSGIAGDMADSIFAKDIRSAATSNVGLINRRVKEKNANTSLGKKATLANQKSSAKVSPKDMQEFASKLNMRRDANVGVNPHAEGFLQVPFGPVDYKGVKQVSNKFMLDIYPDQDIRLVIGMFTTIGLDKVVFNKFMRQVYLYGDGDKATVVGLIGAFCGDGQLAERLFKGYYEANAASLRLEMQHNPYANDIKERQ